MDTNPTLLRGLRRRLRSRLNARGVAMVEGAIVFPILSLFLIMLELGHHAFDAYITVGHVARERAWSAATTGADISNCSGGARDDQLYASVRANYMTIGTGTTADPPPTGKPNIDSGGHSFGSPVAGTNGFFKHTAAATADVHVSRGGNSGFVWPHAGGTFSPHPNSSVTVYCNQKWHGTLIDIIASFFHK